MDEKFRKAAEEQICAEKYVDALICSGQIKIKAADDYRRMAVCEDKIGHTRITEKNLPSAIEHFTLALSCMRDAILAKEIESDASESRRLLSVLLNTMNNFLKLFIDRWQKPLFEEWQKSALLEWQEAVHQAWQKPAEVLESFLRFYVVNLLVFNKTVGKLSNLDEFDRNNLRGLILLSQSASQKKVVHIYFSTIALFHEGLTFEENLAQNDEKDPLVVKAFAVYTRALALKKKYIPYVAPPEPEPEPQPVLPSVVVVPPVVALPPVRIVKPVKVSASRAAATQPVPKCDQFDPPEKKRADIGTLMAMKMYGKAAKLSEHIFDRVSFDYRRAAECYYHIGNEHFDQERFQQAIESYKEALLQCKHIEKTDVIDEDHSTIATVFTALIKSFDEITREWPENFGEASKSVASVLDFYVDYFDEFHWKGKKLPGLDKIDIGNMIPFLSEIGDAAQQKITKIYLTVIAMFRQDAKLEAGELSSFIAEFENTKEVVSDNEAVRDAFYLFQRALKLVRSTKYRGLLNPEIQAVPEPEQKRWKGAGDSSSSSSLPSYLPPFGLAVRPAVTPDRRDLPKGFSQSFTK